MGRPFRIHVDAPLKPGEILSLEGEQAHRLSVVLRKQSGDLMVLFNGDGLDYPATVHSSTRHRVTLALSEPVSGLLPPEPPLWLGQSLIKQDRFDWVVQKATELGVARITPVIAQRSVVALQTGQVTSRLDRWRRIAIEASEQCGRADVPAISEPVSLPELLASSRVPAIMLWEDEAHAPLLTLMRERSARLLLVGPEGGFTPDEIALARATGVRTATLGPLVLRSETAAVAALAAIRVGLLDR